MVAQCVHVLKLFATNAAIKLAAGVLVAYMVLERGFVKVDGVTESTTKLCCRVA